MKDNNKTPKEHNPFNVFPDDVSLLSGVISSAYKEAEIQDKIREEVRKETAKEIILRINQVRKTHLGHLRSEIDLICRKYGIDEDEV